MNLGINVETHIYITDREERKVWDEWLKQTVLWGEAYEAYPMDESCTLWAIGYFQGGEDGKHFATDVCTLNTELGTPIWVPEKVVAWGEKYITTPPLPNPRWLRDLGEMRTVTLGTTTNRNNERKAHHGQEEQEGQAH